MHRDLSLVAGAVTLSMAISIGTTAFRQKPGHSARAAGDSHEPVAQPARMEGRPYFDGVEFTIIKEVSTANLAFVAYKVDRLATLTSR